MAWSLTHANLLALLKQKILLPKDSHILMAVSGGQDSLCLARLLIDLKPKWQWTLAIVHCDHRWREDSSDNADHVLALARQWQLPAWVEVAEDVPGSEAAAREWRYGRLATVAQREGCTHVVTGHTESDRAETVLYNLIRGTGIDGIATLPWVRSLGDSVGVSLDCCDIKLVRPLLNLSRGETAAFCQEHQLPIWEDSSNQNLKLRRNRIRQELLPYVKEHFNPQVEKALAQMADISAADTDYLNSQAAQLFRQCTLQAADASWEIDRQLLRSQPLAMQRRVIRRLLQEVLRTSPNFSQIEKLIGLLEAPNGSQSDPFPGGWIASVRKPLLVLRQIG